MNCSECQNLLSEYIDNELSESGKNKIKSHLEKCRECRFVYEDLRQIVSVSKQLPLVVPQNEIWEMIERDISIYSSISQQDAADLQVAKQKPFWEKFWGYRVNFSFTMPQLAAAFFCFMLVGLGFTLTYRPQILSSAALLNTKSSTVVAGTVSFMKLDEADLHASIDRHLECIRQRQGRWDPEIKRLFERNLAIVDRSVEECKQLVERNPEDQIAHEMMMMAYKDKVRLLEQFASLE